MTVYRALVTPVEGTIVATPSDVRQMLVRVGGSVSVSGGTGSSTLAGLTDVALDGSPTAGQQATFDADGRLTNTDPASEPPFLVPTIPGLGFAFVVVSAVDGTATSITFITPSAGAEADGVIPAGWAEVATFPVGSIPPGTYTLVVPAGDLAGVYTVATAAIDQPWPEVDIAAGTVGIASGETGLGWLAVKTATGWGPDLAAISGTVDSLGTDLAAISGTVDSLGTVYQATHAIWVNADLSVLPGQIATLFDRLGTPLGQQPSTWWIGNQDDTSEDALYVFTPGDPPTLAKVRLPGPGLLKINQAFAYASDAGDFVADDDHLLVESGVILIGAPTIGEDGEPDGSWGGSWEFPKPRHTTSPVLTGTFDMPDFWPVLRLDGATMSLAPTDDSTGIYRDRVFYVVNVGTGTSTLVGDIHVAGTTVTDMTLAVGQGVQIVGSPDGWRQLGGFGGATGGGLDETAVQALIDSAVSNLLAGAPGALDTLNELAAALGDDANFAASVTTALAGKQAASAVLTALDDNGTPGATGLALLLAGTAAAARSALGQGWQTIADVSLSGLATKDVDLTGYRAFRFRFRGASTIAGTSGSLKLRFNADSANNYASNTTNSSAFLLGNIPGTTTNTDRIRQVVGEFTLSDGTTWSVGSTLASGAGLSTDTAPAAASPVNCSYLSTSAITSLTLFTSGGENFSAASRLVVEALG